MAKLDFNWIVPGVAQGAYPDPPSQAWQQFDVLVLAAEELQPRITAPSHKALFKVPLDDDVYRPVPSEVGKILHDVARKIAKFVVAGHPVLITCAQGLNRSGIITALVLMYAFGMSPDQAINSIRRGRGQYALCNTMFTQWLRAHR